LRASSLFSRWKEDRCLLGRSLKRRSHFPFFEGEIDLGKVALSAGVDQVNFNEFDLPPLFFFP